MKEDVKKQWVEALRSGEYKQGMFALKRRNIDDDDSQYCCLGVLCNLIDPDGWDSDDDSWYSKVCRDRGYTSLPLKLRDGLGISHEQEDTLMSKNDHGETFLDISDYIEEHL